MKNIPVIVVRENVIFPHVKSDFLIKRPLSLNSLMTSLSQDREILLVLQKDLTQDELKVFKTDTYQEERVKVSGEEFSEVGVICKIHSSEHKTQDCYSINVFGINRVRVKNYELVKNSQGNYYLEANQIKAFHEPSSSEPEFQILNSTLIKYIKEHIVGMPYSAKIETLINSYGNGQIKPLVFVDCLANLVLHSEINERQKFLEESTLAGRVRLLIDSLLQEIGSFKAKTAIKEKTLAKITREQHKAFLREQLHTIRKELGEEEEEKVSDNFIKRVKTTRLPIEARKVCDEEIRKLEALHPSSAEYHVARNYVEAIISVPWYKSTKDNIDLDKARKVLDQDHYGMDKIKQRIIQFLAVAKLKNSLQGPILCLVGPPGVGKTTLARSISTALGRKFARLALGGVRDESEIRGHRRTYVGAMPGKMVQTFKKLEVNNPLILLDEIDKLGKGNQGDPGAALLEVLDPEQNVAFQDHFLDLSLDLSKALFICTANSLQDIPGPLRDRLEIINLSGYTNNEKKYIAKNHLVPSEIKSHGLKPSNIQISDDNLTHLISGYTKEPGVRELQRVLATLMRHAVLEILEKDLDKVVLDKQQIAAYLGPEKYSSLAQIKHTVPGVVSGLAWTSMGGEVLSLEAILIPQGQGQLKLTGSLGEVMRESALIAFSHLKSKAVVDIAKDKDIHLHFPSGAIPKDGPSAGVTIFTALYSLLSGRAVSQSIAMTGEVSLTGRVLAVGGIKEKLMAAHLNGYTQVIVPEANKIDLLKIPDEVVKDLKIHLVSSVDELLKIVFN